MRVDTTQTVSGNRQSVRITTNYTFTQGLVVLDAVHAPTGCGTWPAFWTDGTPALIPLSHRAYTYDVRPQLAERRRD